MSNIMEDAPLIIEKVSKSYGKQSVLREVSLTVNSGEIFGLIGLNGVGKTTLLKTILGLTNHNGGNINIFGLNSINPASHRNLVYLPEKFYPSKYLKGWEYLKLCCSYYNQPLDKDQAATLSELLDLPADKLSQQVSAYSKGMAQKLGLLGTMIIAAPLLILDEPMSGLDPRARIKLKTQLAQTRNLGKSIFFSSHILSDLDEICDRIGVLHNGGLLFIGTPEEFKHKYAGSTLEQAFLEALESTEDKVENAA